MTVVLRLTIVELSRKTHKQLSLVGIVLRRVGMSSLNETCIQILTKQSFLYLDDIKITAHQHFI